MKNIKLFLAMFAVITFMFASCTEEDTTIEVIDPVEEIDTTKLTDNPLVDQIEGRDNEEGCELGCFTIDYPFSISINGEVYEIDSEDDLDVILLDSLSEDAVVDFVYPFNITFEDGETETINNADELGLAFSECIPDEGWDVNNDTLGIDIFPAFLINSEENCFDLVYPITLQDESGNNIVIDDEEAFIAAYTSGESFLFFTFPLSLTGEEDVVVANGEDLFDLLLTCEYDNGGVDTTFTGGDFFGCYEFAYPFSVILTSGEEVIINNHEEFCNILQGNVQGFGFPLTLIDEAGDEIVVNSEEELIELFQACDTLNIDPWDSDGTLFILLTADNDVSPDGYGCYSVNFPVSVDTGDEIIEINSAEEGFGLNEQLGLGNVVFPVSIILNSNGEEVEINSILELLEVFENC